jgi:hypothetical protein
MSNTVKTGVILGLLVEAWTYIVGVAGWHRDPTLVNLFYVVVLIEIGLLYWGLKKEAATGKSYGGLVGAGTLMSVVGAVIIFIGAMVFTMVVFPEYFAEVREAGRRTLLAKGLPAAEVEKTLEMAAPMQTPFINALMGAVMTVLTGFISSLVIGVLVRKRTPAGPTS